VDVVVHQIDGISTLPALPLAAGLLVASARRDPVIGAVASLSIHTARLAPDAVAASHQRPDVLAFSAYAWNERHSLEVARRARTRRPDAFVLFGGPSVPRRPERAARFLREHPYVDALAFGEGELLFREVLRALLEGRPLDGVAGLALRAAARPEGALLTAPRARLADFAETASPYLDGTFDGLVAPGAPPPAAIVETNRGCPFSCTFCDWGQAVQSPVRELPLARLHGELEWIARRQIPYLYIVDANYGMRRRDLDVVRHIGRLRAAVGFPRYVFFHLTKNATERHLDVVLALREAGIETHLALSTQDFEPRVLQAVRRENIRLDRALALRRICHERGIPTFNELILGLPEQTYASFADGVARAVTPLSLDTFNLYLARVLENAEMGSVEQRARHGIETRAVPIHPARPPDVAEVEEVVVATRTLPVADWRRAFALGYLLTAAHGLRLLDVVMQVAWRAAGVPVRRLVEALLARMATAPPASALGRIHIVLERHADAVLAAEAMALPAPETGDHLWAVEEAVLVTALAAGEAFFAEVAALVREDLRGADTALLEDAVRYQRLVTPAFGSATPRHDVLAHDIPAWRLLPPAEDGPAVPRRRTRVAWTLSPALAGAGDLRAFATAYLAAVHARTPTGRLTVSRGRARIAPSPSSPAPAPRGPDEGEEQRPLSGRGSGDGEALAAGGRQ
jgi:hypothetical protein